MRICLLKVAPIADDPRVRKQGDALLSAGHDVWAVGTAGGRSEAPTWPVSTVAPPSRTLMAKISAALRLLVLGRIGPASRLLYWSFREHRDLLRAARARPADLYLASDWRVLPVALAAAADVGADVGYDSHELGVEEFLERRLWRLLFPPFVRSVERRSLPSVRFVTTVSEGIAGIIQTEYALPRRPVVVRNVPAYERAEFRPTGATIEVLYHGMFISNRGLEPLIESVVAWRPEFRLTLRGFGKPEYQRRLQRLVASSPASRRIALEPPVPMTELIRAACTADIGIHPLLVTSNQMRYTLPNKLFEYLMAGLAVCVTGIPEMAEIVERFGVGVTVPEPTAAGIAAAVNSLDRASIDACKQRALVAAKELCWEHEAEKLLAVVGR